MKKILVLLIAALSFGAVKAQTGHPFVQAKVSTFNGLVSEGVEIGGVKGKNRVSITAESFDSTGSARKYFGGVKYARAIETGQFLDFLLSGEAKVALAQGAALSVEPGVGVDIHLGKNVSLIGGVSSPLFQNEAPFRSLNLKGSAGLQVKF